MRLNWPNRILIYSLGLVAFSVTLTAAITLGTAFSLAKGEFLGRNVAFARYTSMDVLRSFAGAFTGTTSGEGLATVKALDESNPDLVGIAILTESGRTLFSNLEPGLERALDAAWPRGLPAEAGSVVRTAEGAAHVSRIGGRRYQDVLAPVSGQGGTRPLALRYVYGFESLEASSRALLGRVLFGALGLLAVGSVLSVLLSGRLTRPVQVLALGARRVSRGDRDHRIELRTGDELEDLAGQFNAMVDSLREHQEKVESANRELIAANARLKSLQDQLLRTERLAALGQLSAGVSHELDNPIGVILGYAGLVSEEAGEGTPLKEYGSVIAQEARRCKRIVSGLLDFARPGRGQRRVMDLGGVIREQVESLREQGPFRRIEWVLDLGKDEARVSADPDAVRQVVVNLALNGAQAMEGQGRISVRLRGGEDGGFTVAVEDTGPGIPEPDRERVFEPFFTTKAKGRGTGLGLAICRKLIEEAGGWIRAQAGPGGRVEFWLPEVRTDGGRHGAGEET